MRYATFFCLLAEDAHRIARQTGEPVEEVLFEFTGRTLASY